jgi:hypothetical protein
MSTQGLHFQIQKGLASNSRLSAVYDFSDSSEVTFVGAGSDYTGIIPNSSFSNNDSNHTGFLLGAYGSTQAIALSKAYNILDTNKLPLTSGNFKVPLDGLNSNNLSAIIDFEFNDDVSNGILMGCFEKGSETIESTAFENSKGFNIGVTDRGHLFCQTFGSEGDATKVFPEIELSKRNLVGISISDYSLSVSHFDYFNNITKSVELPIDKDYISEVESIMIGGSEDYYRSSSEETPTFSGTMNNLAIFSGYFDSQVLKDYGEAIISDYTFTSETSQSQQRVTGYDETITYKTGITGYEYTSTGSLTIETGRETFTGSFTLNSSSEKEEGDRIYKYYTLNNGDSKTFYKEELGQLHSNSGFVYYPTGENAYDTLGLNDISESIQTFVETTGISRQGGASSVSITLYGKTPLTGTLSEISGVEKTPLSETYYIVTPASSGYSLEGDSNKLKKDYIYYMGERL